MSTVYTVGGFMIPEVTIVSFYRFFVKVKNSLIKTKFPKNACSKICCSVLIFGPVVRKEGE